MQPGRFLVGQGGSPAGGEIQGRPAYSAVLWLSGLRLIGKNRGQATWQAQPGLGWRVDSSSGKSGKKYAGIEPGSSAYSSGALLTEQRGR